MADKTMGRYAAVLTTGDEERRITLRAHTLTDAVLKAQGRTKAGEVAVAVGEEEYIQ